jgi:two-component system cell cycle sensor histidine kinase/response regulator CckA
MENRPEADQTDRERYRYTLDGMLEGCQIIGFDWRYLYINDAAARHGRRPREEYLGRTIMELYPGVESTKMYAALGRCMAERTVQHMENEFTYPDGSTAWFELSIQPVPEGIFVLSYDITEHKRAANALRESEDRYRMLFENSMDAILLTVPDGRVLAANEAACRMFGRTEEELKAAGRNGLVDARDPRLQELLKKRTEEGMARGELLLVRKDGSTFLGEVSSHLFRDMDGNTRTSLLIRDITDRKRMEDGLREAARLWNTTFDAMNDAISIMDNDGRILRSNKAMLDLVGRYPQELAGHPCWEVFHEKPVRIEECPFLKMKKTRRRASTVLEWHGRWFDVTADPIIDSAGRQVGGVHIMTDVTEHRQFEEQLRESESKFRSLAEQSLVGIYIVQDHLFRYVNPRLAEMFGYPSEEIIDRMGPIDLTVPEDRRIVEDAAVSWTPPEGSVSHYEARGQKKSGEIMHAEVFGSSAYYQGRPAVIGVVLDVTEKKKLEAQLRHAQKMEAIGQLTGGIAHDFNNILSAIIGYTSLMHVKLAEGDPLKTFADQILASSERAAVLTRSLLTFSRKQKTSLAPTDINETVRRIEGLLRRIIGEDINLDISPAPVDLVVNADAGQLEQVLMNLATNARDAMPKGGMLSIATSVVEAGAFPEEQEPEPGRSCALVTVSDTGVGMDAKTREKIFEPFFTTKELGRGTGLGLSMVYGIIKQHNGQIHCYSEPGRGTTFRIYLPLLVRAAEPALTRESVPATEKAMQGTETILVVEDYEVLRKLAVTTLGDYGYRVIEAVDGDDAVVKFRENRDAVSLVLCDVIMPGKNGREVLEEIRKLSADVKFVFMSGYPAGIIQEKSLLDKQSDIIGKPMPPTALVRKVREVLDRK